MSEVIDLLDDSSDEEEIVATVPSSRVPNVDGAGGQTYRDRRVLFSDDDDSCDERDASPSSPESGNGDEAGDYENNEASSAADDLNDTYAEEDDDEKSYSDTETVQHESDHDDSVASDLQDTMVDSPSSSVGSRASLNDTRRTIFTPSPERGSESESERSVQTPNYESGEEEAHSDNENGSDDNSSCGSFRMVGKLPSPNITTPAQLVKCKKVNTPLRINDLSMEMGALKLNPDNESSSSEEGFDDGDESFAASSPQDISSSGVYEDEVSLVESPESVRKKADVVDLSMEDDEDESSPAKESAPSDKVEDAVSSPTEEVVTPSRRIDHNTGEAWTYASGYGDYSLSSEGKTWPESDNHVWADSWPNFSIPKDLYDKLFEHQKVGVQWMASLHANGVGGIMGDDMGMGKTYQTLTLVGGLMRERTIRNALILCPVSLMRNWEKEARMVIKKFCGVNRLTVSVITSDLNKNTKRNAILQAVTCSSKLPHLVICTYGQVSSTPKDLIPEDYYGNETHWDYVIADEGHKLKNPKTKVHQGCQLICQNPKTHRLLLTGTFIQNNLQELWALFDWATSGQALPEITDFKRNIAKPIEAGRDKKAFGYTLQKARMATAVLQNKIRPYLLQRLKKDVLADKLPSKRDLVVWTNLSTEQRALYEEFVRTDEGVRNMMLYGEKTSPLVALTHLKKLCGHPVLVDCTDGWHGTSHMCREKLLSQSEKLQALVALVDQLCAGNHRTLIFSQSTRILDIIAAVLDHVTITRIDGSTKERDRQYLVDDFNREGSHVSCMLLSTKAGGLGLTLTGADRAIIYDPSWNPAEDSQAVDRCYRIGASKPVTIYRLIAAGTVEERMYEKQVFKDGIKRAVVNNKGGATHRHFTSSDLKRLFALSPIGVCEMLTRTNSLATSEKTAQETEQDSLLQGHPSVVGISSHDNLYAGKAPPPEEEPTTEATTLVEAMDKENVENVYIPLGQKGMLNKSRQQRAEAKENSDSFQSFFAAKPAAGPDNVIDLSF